MSRLRKPLSQQKGNLTTAIQLRKEAEEKAVKGSRDKLLTPPPSVVDKRAKAKYRELAKLLAKEEIIGDLDRDNIAGYCNAYIHQCDAEQDLSDYGLFVEEDGLRMENPAVKTHTKYCEECRKYAATLGMTISSRLQLGTAKVEKQETKIVDLFGDI